MVTYRKLFLFVLIAGIITLLVLAYQDALPSSFRISYIKSLSATVRYLAPSDDKTVQGVHDSQREKFATANEFLAPEGEQASKSRIAYVKEKASGNDTDAKNVNARPVSKQTTDKVSETIPKAPTVVYGDKSVGHSLVAGHNATAASNKASALKGNDTKTENPLMNKEQKLSVSNKSVVPTLRPPVNKHPNNTDQVVPKPSSELEPYFTTYGALPPPLDAKQSGQNGYIVYECNKLSKLCGGWGDRQRGIVSVYLLARLTNRKFKIIMDTPCELSHFYLPNHVPWIVQPKELNTSSHLTFDTFKNRNNTFLEHGDFNVKYPQKVIFFKTNQNLYLALKNNPVYSKSFEQWPGLKTKRGRLRWAWQEAMRPSPSMMARLELILGKDILIRQGIISKSLLTSAQLAEAGLGQVSTSNLICAHVRVGKNPTIPNDVNLSFRHFSESDIPKLLSFMRSKDIRGDAKFFVATDSEHVKQQSKLFFDKRLVEYGGKIMHIDRQRDAEEACVGFEGALLDQLILSVCDVLIVSRSGFSIHAAVVSNSTNPVYIMDGGNITVLKRNDGFVS